MSEEINSKIKWCKPVTFPGWYKKMSSNFRQFFKSQFLVDVIFHCEEGGTVGAHQTLLCHASPIFKSFKEIADFSYNDDNIWHVSIPEVSKEDVSCFIEALYLGSVPADRDFFKKFQTLSEMLLGISNEWWTAKDHHDTQTLHNNQSEIDNEEEAINQEITEHWMATPKSIKMEQQEQSYVNASADDLNNSKDVNLIRIDGTEVFVVKTVDDQNYSGNFVADTECELCYEMLSMHRIELETDEDRQMYNVSENYIHNIWKCCVENCMRTFVDVKHFNAHRKMHITGNLDPHDHLPLPVFTSQNSKHDKHILCPLCHEARTQHRNELNPDEPRNLHRGRTYRCCRCSAAKMSCKKFVEHVQNHIEKQFKCDTCGKGYSAQLFLDDHIYREHGEGKDVMYKCNVEHCRFETKHPKSLKSHMKDQHTALDKKRSHRSEDSKVIVQCAECGKSYKKWYYQQVHMQSCGSNSAFLRCDFCKQDGFVNPITLNNHIKSKHSNERPHSCEYCPNKYATSMALSGHRSRVHGVNKAGEAVIKKLFTCETCGKLLTTKSKLEAHVKAVHEGLKPFSCTYCNKRFGTNGNLKNHEVAMHTGEFPHRCSLCDKGFTRKQALFSHIQQNHSIESRPKTVHTITMNMPESVQSTILVPDTSLNLDVKPEMYVN